MSNLGPKAVLIACLAPLAAGGCATAGRTGAENRPAPASPRQEAPSTPGPFADNGPARDDEVRRAGSERPLRPEQKIGAHLDLGRALEAQGQQEAALDEYRRAVEASRSAGRLRAEASERARLHRRLGGALDRLGRFDESAEHYQAAQRLAPKDPSVWNDAGYSAYLQGRWEDAERALRRAAELDPSDPRIATNLGLTLAASGRREEAIAAFTRAGDAASAHANLAFVLAAEGDEAGALGEYRAALRLDPGLEQARRGLGVVQRTVARAASPNAPEPTARP